MSYHKRDVHGPDDVDLGVTGRLLGHKHKSFGVEGVELGAVLQEGYVLPRPVLPGVERSVSPDVFCFDTNEMNEMQEVFP